MKVLMFGWEYPPHISGGLGTACHGLTKALSRKGIAIDFVVPRLYGDEPTNGAELCQASGEFELPCNEDISKIESSLSFLPIASTMIPYESEQDYAERMKRRFENPKGRFSETKRPFSQAKRPFGKHTFSVSLQGGYGSNLFEEVRRYSMVAGSLAKQKDYDIIHAHDWLCYKAGEVAKKISGKPLIVHVHATEYDRSGENINRQVYELERQGMEAADVIVCVSEFTRKTVITKYNQPSSKVVCIHNGVEPQNCNKRTEDNIFGKTIVSFIGRVTYQKGPDYFVEAAAKVLEKDRNFVFVMAGDGDMLDKMTALVAKKRISENFFFTGFLKPDELKQLLAETSVFVMPSVSEPFGIAPLEAMSSGVAAVISRQSGVSEVLTHAIKVDFWDIDAMSDAIYSIGRHKALSDMLCEKGKAEVAALTWDKAADKLSELYNQIANKTPQI